MSPTATRSGPKTELDDGTVSDATVALDWRKKKNRRRFVLKIAIPLLVLVVVAAGVWVVGFSSAFVVRGVDVRGAELLSARTVTQTAQVPMGQPLARVDVTALTQRIAALREVASVRVERSWPSTLTIELTERKPVFVVAQAGGYLLVDRQGIGFRFVGERPAGLSVAQVDAANAPLLTEIAAVAAALPNRLRTQVQAIQAATPDSIVLELDQGRSVVWGDSSRSADKAAVLEVLLKQKATAYDVSAPDHPALRK